MKKYDNIETISELGSKPADIRKKTVTVLGMGALGSSIATLLARIGVNLRVIDKDRVYEADLDKLSLFGEEHISKFKAKEAKKLLEDINKDIKVKAFHEELLDNNAYLVDADVVIDCSNNDKTTDLADKARKKTPMIYTRASGVDGCALIIDDYKFSSVQAFLEKNKPTHEQNAVLPTTIQLTAAVVVNKTLKLLTGQKYEKNLLVINGWKYAIEKVAVRKAKK